MTNTDSIVARWLGAACTALVRSTAAAIFSLVLGMFPASAGPSPEAPAEEKAIGAVVERLLARLEIGDRAALDNLVTADFYAFDAGMRMSLSQLFAAIAEARAAGRVFIWSVSSLKVRAEADTAWATWCNVGAITDSGGIKPQRWLESAVLVRSDTGWRISFLHSTRQAVGRGFAADCAI